MKIRTKAFLVLAVISSLLVATPGAGAQDRTEEELSALPNDEFLVAMYAREYGVSEEEASVRLERNDRAAVVLAEIREIEADRLAGAGISHDEVVAGWVRVTGNSQVSKQTRDLLRANRDLTIEIERGADFTLAELEEIIDDPASMAEIDQQTEDLIVSTDVDQRTGELVVTLDEEQISERELGNSGRIVEASIKKNLGRKLGQNRVNGRPVVSTIRGRKTEASANMEGGQSIKTSWDPTTGQRHLCTSGFGVERNGVKGFLTAGHCRVNGRTITEHFDTREHSTQNTSWHVDAGVNRDLLFGEYGDSTWYSLGGDPRRGLTGTVTDDFWKDEFHVNPTDVTTHAVRANMMGRFVCQMGGSSGRSCGTVNSISHDPNYVVCEGGWLAGCSNRWVRVVGDNLQTCKGDSGGPVYAGRVAYGVLSGAVGPDDGLCGGAKADFFTFTAIDDIEARLNVTILIN